MSVQSECDRITCFFSVAAGSPFPDDAHAFWDVQDSLGDALHALGGQFCGSDPVCAEFRRTGSLLWISSDTPDDAHYFWILLPCDAAFRQAVVETTLAHLSQARALLPEAYWDVHLAGQPLVWDGGAAKYLNS